jgi:hypothetical protein
MKHALEGLDPSLRLSATLLVLNQPKQFAFVSRLALVSQSQLRPSAQTPSRVILEVSKETAVELADRLARLRSSTRVVEVLTALPTNLDDDDLRRLQKGDYPFFRMVSRIGTLAC